MNILHIIVLLAFSIAIASADEKKIKLAAGGKPLAAIVLADQPTPAAKEGAEILSEHLEQISGAEFRTVSESEFGGGEAAMILVGESSVAKEFGASAAGLGPGGILIRTYPDKGAISILGADDPKSSDPGGTRYAVTTFLEMALGVRFLWPGELGKVVPQGETVEIAPIDHTFSPLLHQRRIRMFEGYGKRMAQGGAKLGITEEEFLRVRRAATATESHDGGWGRWHRLGGTLRLASGHSFGDYWERFGKTHPEWFAMAPDGSRDQSRSPDRARLCVSNKELIAQVARDRVARIEATGQKSISIGPNDGGQTAFCTCLECEALDVPTERRTKNGGVPLTDRYVRFYNEVAKLVTAKHSEVWLTADAYSLYAAPPVRAKLHPNIAIRYVGVTYTDDARRRQNLADWHAWADAASKIYFRSNLLLAGRRPGTPVIYAHKLAEDFPPLAKNKMIGTDMDSICNNWATQGLNYYLMAKLVWDPDLDVDDLLDDYCRAGFGAGANHVKAYFLKLEALTDAMSTTEMGYTEPFTPEVIAELRTHLDKARTATGDDPATNKRVKFLRAGLDYTDAYCEIFRIDRERQAKGEKMTAEWKARLGAACDHNWKVSRETFEKHHLAVNIPNVAWGSWGYFGRFGWKPPQMLSETRKSPGAE